MHDVVDPGEFDRQYLAVEEEDGGQGLILGGRAHLRLG
jgi:hypothetical protein